MRYFWVFRESRALVICIRGVQVCDLLSKFEPPYWSPVVQEIVKLGDRGIALENICRKHCCLSCCRVWRKVGLFDDVLYNLRLGYIDSSVLDDIQVDSILVLYVSLVFIVLSWPLQIFYRSIYFFMSGAIEDATVHITREYFLLSNDCLKPMGRTLLVRYLFHNYNDWFWPYRFLMSLNKWVLRFPVFVSFTLESFI